MRIISIHDPSTYQFMGTIIPCRPLGGAQRQCDDSEGDEVEVSNHDMSSKSSGSGSGSSSKASGSMTVAGKRKAGEEENVDEVEGGTEVGAEKVRRSVGTAGPEDGLVINCFFSIDISAI
jgi:hypothetical protein